MVTLDELYQQMPANQIRVPIHVGRYEQTITLPTMTATFPEFPESMAKQTKKIQIQQQQQQQPKPEEKPTPIQEPALVVEKQTPIPEPKPAVEEATCESCQRVFKNARGLSIHSRHCKA
jgi:hypothetical protein